MNLNTPQSINHIGGRSNNEDSIYPIEGKANEDDTLFIVCDGVGGSEKGEVASRLACDKFAKYVTNNGIMSASERDIALALVYVEEAFDTYFESCPDAKGMGTTLTLLQLHDNGATVAHVGDSRVYQYRDGQIVFQTQDHSLVNDLLKAGIIDEEQAKDHPKKNVISRAIQGGSVKSTKADVQQIDDIQSGDYFFLCTDGILENLSDFEIGQILLQDISDDQKIQQINDRCEESPNDNFSAYLVPIAKELRVDHDEVVVEAEIAKEVFVEPVRSKMKKWFLIIPVLLISLATFWFYKTYTKPQEEKPTIKEPFKQEGMKKNVDTSSTQTTVESVKDTTEEKSEVLNTQTKEDSIKIKKYENTI